MLIYGTALSHGPGTFKFPIINEIVCTYYYYYYYYYYCISKTKSGVMILAKLAEFFEHTREKI
jgi:hypothetical protein